MARVPDPTLRATILKAARTIFKQKGFTDARMSDIASEAGVAVGTIYLHFKTKEALVVGLARGLNLRMVNESLPLLRQGEWRLALANSLRKTLQICRENKDLILMVYLQLGMAEFTKDSFAEENKEDKILLDGLMEAIRERVERGEAKTYDPMMAAVLVSGLVDRAAFTGFLFSEDEATGLEETLILFLQNALVA